MRLDQFVVKYNGKKVDFDGHHGAQCVDLFRFYLKEVLNVPQPASVVGAYQLFDNANPSDFEKIKNTWAGVPEKGDIVIWNQDLIKNGHVAIFLEGDVDKFKSFDQNNPTGSPCAIREHNYSYIIGWLRPKKAINPKPSMTIHKVLALLNGLSVQQTTVFKQAVEHVKARVAALGNIRIEVDYLVISKNFSTVNGTSTDNQPIAFVKPEEIGIEGRKGEILLSKEFDLVTLIYNPTMVVGPPPTNPVENPMTIEGFNINQIPTSWFEESFDACRLFFYHEMLHSWYYIVNSELAAGQIDQVHSYPGNWEGEQTIEAQMKYFDSLVISLKPYWPALANIAASTEERKSMLSFRFGHTIYIPVFSKFVGIADENTFLELGGNFADVKDLTEAEFNSVVKPKLATQTILK